MNNVFTYIMRLVLWEVPVDQCQMLFPIFIFQRKEELEVGFALDNMWVNMNCNIICSKRKEQFQGME